MFYGPAGVVAMWASADGGPRRLMVASDLPADVAAAVSSSMVVARGDLLAGTGVGAVDRLAVGADGRVLTADSSQPTGLRWAAAGSGGGALAATGTLWVAAADAPAQFADAPYQCDGVDDQSEINEALANAFGMRVGLSPGNFAISAPIQMIGVPNTSPPVSKSLRGTGTYATRITVGAGLLAGIRLDGGVSPDIANLSISVEGQTHGIYAAGPSGGTTVGEQLRTFVEATIRDVTVFGPWDFQNAGGWGLYLSSGYRALVENVRVNGTANGIRIFNDCTNYSGFVLVSQCTVDVMGPNGVGYEVGGTLNLGVTEVTFDSCEGSSDSAGAVGFKVDSPAGGPLDGIRVRNLELSSFPTSVRLGTAARADIDVSYAYVPIGGTFASVAAANCRIAASQLDLDSGGTITAINETNSASAQPNRYELAGNVPANTTLAAVLTSGVVTHAAFLTSGSATLAGVLKAPAQRGRTFLLTKSGALAVAVGSFAVYNDTGSDLVLRSARASVGTAYTTGSVLVDINLAGTTIFTTQSNRPTIAAGSKTSGRATTGVNGVVWGSGLAMTVDIDQIGTAGSGADLVVQVETY